MRAVAQSHMICCLAVGRPFADSGWGMGRSAYSLVEGVDCPIGSHFWTLRYSVGGTFMGGVRVYSIPNFACVL